MTRSHRVAISLVLLISACNDPPVGLDAADAVGNYVAASVEVIDSDHIYPATGAQAFLVLEHDSDLSGRFTIAAADTHDERPLDVDLTGWWELIGDRIVIHPAVSGPFSSLPLSWTGDTLRFTVETRGVSEGCPCRWSYRVVLVRT